MNPGPGLLLMLAMAAGQGPLPNPAASPRYALHFAKAGPGATVQVVKENRQLRQVRVTDANGAASQDRKDEQTDTIVYRETIVEKPAGQERATHLWRLFDRAQRQSSGATAALPEQGQTYDIHKQNGHYQFRNIGGAALPAETARALELEFNSGNEELNWEKLLLPPEPVAAGAAWKLAPEPIIRVLGKATGLRMDTARAEASARLASVSAQGGRLVAVVDAVVTLPATALSQGSRVQELQPGSGIRVQLRLSGALGAGPEDRTEVIQVQVAQAVGESGQRAVTTSSACTIRLARRELPRQ